jgi:hypothetical protein
MLPGEGKEGHRNQVWIPAPEGGPRGAAARAKTSTMIMRPPQHGTVFNAALAPDASCNPNPSDGNKPTFATLALRDIVAKKVTAATVQTVLSGDQHSFQVIPVKRRTNTSLLQLVVGDSGTGLDNMKGAALPGKLEQPPGIWCEATFVGAVHKRFVRARSVYGFVAAVLNSNEWQFALHTVRPADQQWEIPSPNSAKPPKSGQSKNSDEMCNTQLAE